MWKLAGSYFDHPSYLKTRPQRTLCAATRASSLQAESARATTVTHPHDRRSDAGCGSGWSAGAQPITSMGCCPFARREQGKVQGRDRCAGAMGTTCGRHRDADELVHQVPRKVSGVDDELDVRRACRGRRDIPPERLVELVAPRSPQEAYGGPPLRAPSGELPSTPHCALDQAMAAATCAISQ